VKVKAVVDKFVPKWSMYRSGTPLTCTEVVHVPKWSKFRIWRKTCTEVECTEMVMYRTGPNPYIAKNRKAINDNGLNSSSKKHTNTPKKH